MKSGLSLFLVLLVAPTLLAEGELTNKIAFERGGEVWITDTRGEEQIQLTKTGGIVKGYALSPSRRYIAYDSTIFDLYGDSVLCQVGSHWDGCEVGVDRWITDQVLLYILGGDLEVVGWFLYDITSGSREILSTGDLYEKYHRGTISLDHTLLVYTKERFPARLFAEDLLTRREKVFPLEESHYDNMRISDDNKYLLVLSCPNYLGGKRDINERIWELILIDLETDASDTVLSFKKANADKLSYGFSSSSDFVGVVQKTDEVYDRISIYDIDKRETREVARVRMDEEDPYGFSRRFLQWSPNDRYIWISNSSPEDRVLVVVDIETPTNVKHIRGAHSVIWVDSNSFIFSKDWNIYRYDMLSDTTEMFLQSSAGAMYIR